MANLKTTELPAASGVTLDDLLALVDDPAGSPASKKATIAQVRAALLPILAGELSGLGTNVAAFLAAALDGNVAAFLASPSGANFAAALTSALAGTSTDGTFGSVGVRADYVAAGTGNRAATGEGRLPTVFAIRARNGGNTADNDVLTQDAGNVNLTLGNGAISVLHLVAGAVWLKYGAVLKLAMGMSEVTSYVPLKLGANGVANGISQRNAADSAYVSLCHVDTSNRANLGDGVNGYFRCGTTAGADAGLYAGGEMVYNNGSVTQPHRFQGGGNEIGRLDYTEGLRMARPIRGYSAPYASHGMALVTMANANKVLSAAEYSEARIELGGSTNATHVVTLPAPATAKDSYPKWLMSSVMNSLSISIGSGSAFTLAAGATKAVWVTPSGVFAAHI